MLKKLYNCFTLGELFVIIMALIILFYYIYSVRNNKIDEDIEKFNSIYYNQNDEND